MFRQSVFSTTKRTRLNWIAGTLSASALVGTVIWSAQQRRIHNDADVAQFDLKKTVSQSKVVSTAVDTLSTIGFGSNR